MVLFSMISWETFDFPNYK